MAKALTEGGGGRRAEESFIFFPKMKFLENFPFNYFPKRKNFRSYWILKGTFVQNESKIEKDIYPCNPSQAITVGKKKLKRGDQGVAENAQL